MPAALFLFCCWQIDCCVAGSIVLKFFVQCSAFSGRLCFTSANAFSPPPAPGRLSRKMADPVSIIWNVYKAAKFVHKAVKDGAGIDGDLTSLKIQVSQVKEKMRIISGGTFDDKTPENSTLAEAAKKAQNEKLEGHCEKLEGVTFKEFQEHLVKLHDEIKISKNAADSLAKDPTGPGFWSGLKAGVKKAKGMVMASSNRDTLKQHTGNLTTYLAALTSIVQGMYVEKFKALEGKFDAELAKISGGIEVLTWQTSIPQKREELKKVPKKDYQRRHVRSFLLSCTDRSYGVVIASL